MSEALQLRMQVPVNADQHLDRDGVLTAHIVTGVELADGSNFVGRSYNSSLPEDTLILEWEPAKAERVAEYFERYLAAPSMPNEGWNCHSFVTEAMGWDVQWSEKASPCYLPYERRQVGLDQLEDGVPYAISSRLRMPRHSMLGLPDPSQNLSVRGYCHNMVVADNTATLEQYKGKIYPYKAPCQLGRVASWIVDARARPFRVPEVL